MNRHPLISVVIPTYNRKEMAREAIESALAQTYSNRELIVVDDGSTDGTSKELAERYGDALTIVRRESPSGSGAARNAGAEVSGGEFLAFLDSDDVWLPHKLETQMDVMQAHGDEVALVGSACEYMDAQGQPILKPSRPPEHAAYEDFCIRIRLPGSGSNHLIRRKAFDEVGGFDESLTRAQDKDLWIRILEHYQIRYADEVTARIRIHDTERVNVDIGVIMESRRRVDRKVSDAGLRRKATAWSFFSFFRMLWPQQPLRALAYLTGSFLVHPSALAADTKRLKPAARILLRPLR